jgi:probable F420-dependent oxidoreductase
VRVGLCAYNMPAAEMLKVAVHADRLGFDALWLGEHVLLPVDYSTPHPTTGTASKRSHSGPVVGSDTVLVDPLVELAAIAATTERLCLGTAMMILPTRNPLLLARAVCTLQQLSGNRLSLGVGTGWLREEFEALGIEFDTRVGRFGEMIDILEKACAGGQFSYDGTHFRLDPMQISPHPVPLPLIYAGNTDRALRRAATKGDGWFASGIPSMDEALRLRNLVRSLRDQADLTDPFRTIVRIEGTDPDTVTRYVREGLDDLVMWADRIWKLGDDEDTNRRRMEACAADLGLDQATPIPPSTRSTAPVV